MHEAIELAEEQPHLHLQYYYRLLDAVCKFIWMHRYQDVLSINDRPTMSPALDVHLGSYFEPFNIGNVVWSELSSVLMENCDILRWINFFSKCCWRPNVHGSAVWFCICYWAEFCFKIWSDILRSDLLGQRIILLML